jgi:uncharacterized protein (DUF2147 family)
MVRGRGLCRILAALVWIGAVVPVAHASPADGTWLLQDKMAIQISDCESALCGRIVWLRNPALRTPAMCGRTIVWGLTADGPSQWGNGWIFDPEDGNTYHLSATLQPEDTIQARIFEGIPMLGETKVLRRIENRSLPGWC